MTADLTEIAKKSLCDQLELLRNDLTKLVADVSDESFWQKPLPVSNSIGHLVLHLTGNLSHFVGAQLGKTGYIRDRDREFTETNVPAKSMALGRLDDTVAMFRKVVMNLTPEQLLAAHPESRFGPVLNALMHLVAHFALHRGQISYLVRLL